MLSFHHDRLIVYRKSIEFVAISAQVIPMIEPAHAHLRDQLARAATSIALNVAEGAGEFSRQDKHRFYRMARRSAAECAAVLEVLRSIGYPDQAQLVTGRETLHQIVAMLTAMTRPDALRPQAPANGREEK